MRSLSLYDVSVEETARSIYFTFVGVVIEAAV